MLEFYSSHFVDALSYSKKNRVEYFCMFGGYYVNLYYVYCVYINFRDFEGILSMQTYLDLAEQLGLVGICCILLSPFPRKIQGHFLSLNICIY